MSQAIAEAHLLLADAIQALRSVGANDKVLYNSVLAIRLLLQLCDRDERPWENPEDVAGFIDELTERAAPYISMAASRSIDVEEVYLGLAALVGLLRDVLIGGTPLIAANNLTQVRFDHAALLADELDAAYRRHEIERRGDALRRHVALCRFLDATHFGHSLQ